VAHAIAAWLGFFALYLLFTEAGNSAALAAAEVCAGLAAGVANPV
jgi:hypothetical protein